MNKDSSISSVLIFVVIVLLLGGAYWYDKNNKVIENPDKEQGQSNQEQSINNNLSQSSCSPEFQIAIETLNASQCDSAFPSEGITPARDSKAPYYPNYCRELCLMKIALINDDMTLCAGISHMDSNVPLVEGYDDPREVGTYRDHCIMNVAKKTNNTNMCNEVETDWAKTNCPTIVGGVQQ
jgi:hypothetical protein